NTGLYRHYSYLARSFLSGRFDVPTLPLFYHDKTVIDGKTFIPFPPAPSFFLMPLAAIFGENTNQIFFSMIIGALNVGLAWVLLETFGIRLKERAILTVFFGFGTVHWYAAITGTTWFFAHIIAVFSLLLAIILLLKNKQPFLVGLFFGLAALSRHPTLLSLPFFLFLLPKEKKSFLFFFLGATPLFSFQLFYNFSRFGDIFNEGYLDVYRSYIDSGFAYSFHRFFVLPVFPHFGYLDIRNIPLHLFTLFFMPPRILPEFPFLQPSPYGMSVILTSPIFLFSLRANFKEKLVKISWLATGLVSFLVFLHFSQGWVQFGYRFLLDFVPFLFILTALGFGKISKIKIFLVVIGVLANWWGVFWGRTLGW
ncbi:MAG: hypothetical protein Q8N98_03220, partial [bacterium]|nr:hypothetical protein [bacterium]